MRRAPLAALLLVAATLAGCLSDDGGHPEEVDPTACTPSPLDPAGIQYVTTDHDPIAGMHPSNAFLTETTFKRTCSLPAIGHSPLSPDGKPHYYIGEIDMRGDLDLGAVAVLGNREEPRVYLFDISDRAEPKMLSWIAQEHTYIVDVKISDDGRLLFTASQNLPTSPEFAGLPELEGPTGFTVYDISDPKAPRYLMTQADPQYGCHMLSHEVIDGTDTLFCLTQQVRIFTLERADGTVRVTGFMDWIPEEGGAPRPSEQNYPIPVSDPTGQIRPTLNSLPLTSGPHDVTVQRVGDKTIAFVSHWDAGLRIVDVSDPGAPQEIGRWDGEGTTHYSGNVHTAMMIDTAQGRFVITSPEYTANTTVPSIWVLKADDFGAMELVGEWWHPGNHTSQGLFLTTHQWQVAPYGADVDASSVRIYLTYNHAGVWVLDLGHILAGHNDAAILGYNIARTELPETVPVANAILATWDVNLVDGYIYGSDRATGLWIFHYTEDTLGDERLRGFA